MVNRASAQNLGTRCPILNGAYRRRSTRDGTVRASPSIRKPSAKARSNSSAGKKFKAGTLGEREIKEKNVIITGPPLTFTAENIEKFHF